MNRITIFLIPLLVIGCVSLNKDSSRKREAIVIEKAEGINKPKFHIPQIRKPRIFKSPILKVNKKMSNKKEVNIDKALDDALGIEKENEEEIISTPAELNENLNEVERNNRFDNLVELEKEEDQIKEVKESRTDVWMTWIGGIGVLSVFWTGVYFIARNLFYK